MLQDYARYVLEFITKIYEFKVVKIEVYQILVIIIIAKLIKSLKFCKKKKTRLVEKQKNLKLVETSHSLILN